MISSRDFKPLIQKESDFYCPMCNSVKIVKENGKNKCLNCKFIERKKSAGNGIKYDTYTLLS